jgi:WD40 repeat protein
MQTSTLQKQLGRLRNRWPLVGAWVRRSAIRALADDGSAEAIRTLTDGIMHSPHVLLQAEALPALWKLAHQKNADAQEALCRLAIEHPALHLEDTVVQAGYAPKEESERLLFYFLTEQWDKYEALDFDHRLLRTAYENAGPRLRRQVAAKARAAGRIEWVEAVAGGKQGRRLGSMTDAEWKAALGVLQANRRWPEVWRLAQEAPPRRSALLVQMLESARWKPPGPDRPDLAQLIRLANGWIDGEFKTCLQCTATLVGHTDEVRCLAFSPNGRLLATGGGDRCIRLWDLSAKMSEKELAGHASPVNCLAISPDGRYLASGDKAGVVWTWRLPSGTPLAKLAGHTSMVMCLAITPDGRTLVSGSADSNILLWDLHRGEHRRSLEDHTDGILDMAVTPDGGTLASASIDCSVRLWSLPEGRAVRTLRGHRGEPNDAVLCLAMSPDGNTLASGGTDAAICVWRIPSGEHLATLDEHIGPVNCLAVGQAGDVLVSGGADHRLRIWQLPSGEELHSAEAHSGEVARLLLWPDGRMAASIGGYGVGHDHSLRLWSVPEGRPLRTLYGHSRHLTSLALSRDGRFLATASGDRTVRIWSSELERLSRLPVRQATLQDLELAERGARDESIRDGEKAAWKFIAELIRRSRRHDVFLDDARPRAIEIGEFDIEIEG